MVNTFLLQSLVIDLLKSVNGLSKGYQQHGCLSIDCNSYSYRLYEYLVVDNLDCEKIDPPARLSIVYKGC